MKTTYIYLLFLFLALSVSAQTYTSVQNGMWNNASTWDANGVPPVNLSNDDVIINHRVELTTTLKLSGNSSLTINHILNISSGGFEMETNSDVLNINYGLLAVNNGGVLNKAGTINLNYGRIQLCNDNFTDESSNPYGTFGTGTIYTKNGNIEDINAGNFSTGIDWCSENGGSTNMPIAENCGVVKPFGTSCDDEDLFEIVICLLVDPTDNDNDGVPNNCDLDDDNDGITDVIEQDGILDTDADGIFDANDLDSDNDGIPDNVEGQLTLGYITPTGTVDFRTGILSVYGPGLTPVDTDLDGIADIIDLDSDSDGLLDIEENGMADVIVSFSDADADGLDLLFEGSVANDPYDVNDDINSPESSILPDTDGDLYSGGDLDYRDLFNTNPPSSATLDFDGVNDYVVGTSLMASIDNSNADGVTVMGWINNDTAIGNTSTFFMFGENNGIEVRAVEEKLSIYSKLRTKSGNDYGASIVRNNALKRGIWRHIAVSVDFSEELMKAYVDGELVFTRDISPSGGEELVGFYGALTAETEKFMLGRETETTNRYFRGAIDEVRMFDTVLSDNDVKEVIFQEIENDGGNLKGAITPFQIGNIAWNDLILYYPMTNIVNSRIIDNSINNNNAQLYNITTIQPQTAPMPFETSKDGNWNDRDTWLHGDVWAIPGDEIVDNDLNSDENYTWGIYHIKNNVTMTTSLSEPGKPNEVEGLKALAVLVDEKDQSNKDVVYTIGNTSKDLQLNVSKYLQLEGAIDLKGDSQIIQGDESNLVTGANGKILRRQDGNANVFRYTYFSSPVGTTQATTFSDNNTNQNNTNNTSFRLNMLKDGNGDAIAFTTAYDEIGKLSTRWTYTFLNGITYYDWAPLGQSTAVETGVGYIHKGLGNAGSTQEYLFEGKPNNGTVLVAADDVDGDSANESEADMTLTTTLVGNPYPSAIDAHQFIDDNAGVIDGTLYLWQQWAGDSHILAEYEGGYAVINKMAKIRAYQFEGISGGTTGSQDGTLTPTQYIGVGQSFMTEVFNDGDIVFRNSQRTFKKESEGESVFFRNSTEDNTTSGSLNEMNMTKLHLEFNAKIGFSREIVIGFSEETSEEFDYGYDGKMSDVQHNDFYTLMDENPMITQAYSAIKADKVVPLSFKSSESQLASISLLGHENLAENQEVYLRDNYNNSYIDILTTSYEFTTEEGQFDDRFEIVFQINEALSEDEISVEDLLIYVEQASNKLIIKGLQQDTKIITVTDMLGKNIHTFYNQSQLEVQNGIQLTSLSTGIYIVSLETISNRSIDKKIVVK